MQQWYTPCMHAHLLYRQGALALAYSHGAAAVAKQLVLIRAAAAVTQALPAGGSSLLLARVLLEAMPPSAASPTPCL